MLVSNSEDFLLVGGGLGAACDARRRTAGQAVLHSEPECLRQGRLRGCRARTTTPILSVPIDPDQAGRHVTGRPTLSRLWRDVVSEPNLRAELLRRWQRRRWRALLPWRRIDPPAARSGRAEGSRRRLVCGSTDNTKPTVSKHVSLTICTAPSAQQGEVFGQAAPPREWLGWSEMFLVIMT